MSVKNNKKRIPLLNLLINCISARSVPQTLSLKDKYTFCFSDYLILGLCSPSSNCRVAKSEGW